MSRVKQTQAVLEYEDVRAAIAAARKRGPFEHALIAWMYEQGARASEPGIQRVSDVDVRGGRLSVVHLKQEARITKSEIRPAVAQVMMLKYCKEALPIWLDAREKYVIAKEQKDILFPSASPGKCDVCRGSGKWKHTRLKIDKVDPCHHCNRTGKLWGINRYEVLAVVTSILAEIGIPQGKRHPHVFRHSIVTHLLEKGIQPKVIQDRVGHTQLATTLGYVSITKTAASAIEKAMEEIYGE